MANSVQISYPRLPDLEKSNITSIKIPPHQKKSRKSRHEKIVDEKLNEKENCNAECTCENVNIMPRIKMKDMDILPTLDENEESRISLSEIGEVEI